MPDDQGLLFLDAGLDGDWGLDGGAALLPVQATTEDPFARASASDEDEDEGGSLERQLAALLAQGEDELAAAQVITRTPSFELNSQQAHIMFTRGRAACAFQLAIPWPAPSSRLITTGICWTPHSSDISRESRHAFHGMACFPWHAIIA